MVHVDAESDARAERAFQGRQGRLVDVNDPVAARALHVGVIRGRVVLAGGGEVVDRGRAGHVRVGDDAELAERCQGPIDRRAVHARRRLGGPDRDLVGGEVVRRAVKDLDHGAACCRDPLTPGRKGFERLGHAVGGGGSHASIVRLCSCVVADSMAAT